MGDNHRVSVRGARGARGVRWWAGVGLLLAGLAVFGYVGWQLWGTSWVAERKHEQIVSELERRFEGDRATAGEPGEGGPGRGGTQAPRPIEVDGVRATAILRIPAFGDGYAVPVIEGIGSRELAAGFGHFPGSAGPGEEGNFALAGHRITHGEPLRRMPELSPGDEVVVETASATYTYVLTTGGDDLRVTFEDGWVVDPLPRNPRRDGVQPAQEPGQRLLTLTTCAELFHTDDRLVAFGVLTEVSPRR